MFYAWILLFSLITSPVFAETIGPVEYQLPDQGKEWKVAKKFEGNNKVISKTIIYVPTHASLHTTTETFSAHVNNLPSTKMDQDSLKNEISIGVKDDVNLQVIDSKANSVLFEWSFNDKSSSKSHFLTRLFSVPEGTVMLTYEANDSSEYEKVRPNWIKLLNQASMNNK